MTRENGPTGNKPRWLLLIHQIPPKPDYLRVRIGRRLRALGAVAIKNSVYVVPLGREAREGLVRVVREIRERGGDASVCEAHFVEGLFDETIEDLVRAAREADYRAIAEAAKRLSADLRKGRSLQDAERRRRARALERLKQRFGEIVAKDPFGARGRENAAGLLSLAEDRLEGVETAAERGPELSTPPRAATWVTRIGVGVDRIASAWLIRRFIDPGARFKFVSPRGHRPMRGELRFDMAHAEFTHEDERCTFEVLLERFHLRDSALRPIAEIVHDLDLEDSRYGRPEAPGLDRMLVGITLAHPEDEARITHGAAVFDNLYEYFRKHGSRTSEPPPTAGGKRSTRPSTPATHSRSGGSS